MEVASPRYTHRVLVLEWNPDEAPEPQLARWCELAAEPGLIHAVFSRVGERVDLPWRAIEPWTRSRAVTIADVRTRLGSPGRDVALCADMVYLREGVELMPDAGDPTPGLLWALCRAGRAALARGLLDPMPLTASEACALGLALDVLGGAAEVPVPREGSGKAITIARDLMRTSAGSAGNLQLELAAFRLLFASGDPGEGARAFLECRSPDFD